MQNEEVIKVLNDNISRIRSMALVHERLYRSDNLSKIDLSSYMMDLMSFYGSDGVEIRYEVDIGEISIDMAIPMGLIINELVSNATEHAFHGVAEPSISIELKRCGNGGYRIIVSDNGTGLPEGVEFKMEESFGLFLVDVFAKQLEGEISVRKDKGTTFEITVPPKDKLGRARV
jgi:two-component sensor histidine kinase